MAGDVKNSIKQMGDLDRFTHEIKTKKDKLFEAVQDTVINEKVQEEYTDEDKNKLNDLLNSLSEK